MPPYFFTDNLCVKPKLVGDERQIGQTSFGTNATAPAICANCVRGQSATLSRIEGLGLTRHRAFKNVVEQDETPLEDTWHQDALDWVYPI
jgi:hypothetical protein